MLGGYSVNKKKCLSDISIFIKRGITPKYVESEGYTILNQKCIKNNLVRFESSRLCSKNIKIPTEKFLIDGDILINSTGTGTLGRTARFKEQKQPVISDGHLTIVRPNKKQIMPEFLGHYMSNIEPRIINMARGATNQVELSGADLGVLSVPIPPLSEQKAIAKVLSDTDDLIQAIEKKIAKKQLIKKGVMQKLLTPKETNKKKILRRVSMNKEATPKYVEIKDISLSINSGGGTPPTKIPEYYGGRIPWLRTQEITFNRIKETDMKITEEGLHNSSAKWIPKNSVIVAKFGATAGRSAINKIPLTTNEACCCISPDPEQCDYQYLFYILWKNYYHLERLAQGAAQRNLNGQQIKNYMILLPPLPEQKAIAKVLSDIDKQLEVLQKKLNKYKKIKQSLMQSLLTGKIRLA